MTTSTTTTAIAAAAAAAASAAATRKGMTTTTSAVIDIDELALLPPGLGQGVRQAPRWGHHFHHCGLGVQGVSHILL